MERRPQSSSPAPRDFRVGRWLALPSLNVIRDGETERHLEPQIMDLLAFLASAGGRVVSKDEIIDAVWEGRFIAEATLTRSIADLRRVLDDDQRRPEYIETIAKRGYRLVARISAAASAEAHAPRVERSLVVLPFPRSPEVGLENGRPPGDRIADRLASARRSRFVGREAEIELFRSALSARESPFVVLHVGGAGGVGKTTLLQALAAAAEEAGRIVMRVDGRNIEPSIPGFLVALSRSLGVEHTDLPGLIESWPAGGVLLIDTYERLTPLDEWLRQTLLPQLPTRSLVVIAGRDEPASAWRTDAAWAALTRIASLGNFSPDESAAYLRRCGVAAEHDHDALTFSRGHPLALSLIADVLTRGEPLAGLRLDSAPEIVRVLLESFIREVPGREHRLALYACVTARAITEPLLATALGRSDAHDLYEWLGQLSFVEHGPYGLFPHDLARDVIFMDFRWRDPDAAFQITERVLGYLYERLDRTRGPDWQRVWFDVIYVQRYNRRLRPFFEWAGFGTAYAEAARAADHATILEMVERHEGSESASIAGYWLSRQPQAFVVIRHVGGALMGFAANLCLDVVTPEDVAADPAIALAVAFTERHGPPRPGERVFYGRFWMDAERYQALNQVFTVVAAICSQTWIAPATSWSFASMSAPDLMEPMFDEVHFSRARAADFEVGGKRYGVFAHDWRVESAREWLRSKAERALRIDDAVTS